VPSKLELNLVQGTLNSRSPPESRSTSATPTPPGSVDRTRTPTDSCVNTCRRGPTSTTTQRRTWLGFSAVSTVVPAGHSDT